MNIIPINYQYHVVKNGVNTNPVTFHARPQAQVVGKMGEAVTGNSGKSAKNFALFLAGTITAVASFLGIKKTSDKNNTDVVSEPTKEIAPLRTTESKGSYTYGIDWRRDLLHEYECNGYAHCADADDIAYCRSMGIPTHYVR